MIKMEGLLLELDVTNVNKTKFSKSCVINFPDKIPVLLDFGQTPDLVVGFAKIKRCDEKLICQVTLMSDLLNNNECFVGGYYTNVKMHEEGNIKVVDSCHLYS